MFDEISLKKIDAKYFNIILLDNKDITLQSRNTGHYSMNSCPRDCVIYYGFKRLCFGHRVLNSALQLLGNLWKLNYALNIRGCEYLIDNRTCLWYAKVSMRKCVQNRKYRFFRK